MTQGAVAIAAAGGIDDPDNPIGTDPMRVMAAIESVDSGDGVVVLMDLGSALLSAEMAVEFLSPALQANVFLSGAPLVEGAMAAAVQASVGATVAQVLAEAQSALNQVEARMVLDRHVVAPRPGRVLQVLRSVGDLCRRGGSVAVISDASDGRLRCYAFFPLSEGKRVRAAMVARVEPSIADRERYGLVKGAVREVEPLVGTRESMSRVIDSPEFAQDIERRYGGIVSAVIDLEEDTSTPTRLRWTGGTGYPDALPPGTLCEVDVVTEEVAPAALLLPWLKQAFDG